MATPLSDTEVARAAWYAFGDLGQNDVVIMTAIAMAESNNNDPASLSPGAKAGGAGAYGLWQIENNHPEFGPAFFTSGYAVPSTNALAARSIYNTQHYEAWSSYTDGRYTQFISRAQVAVQATQGTQYAGQSEPFGSVLAKALGLGSGSGAPGDPTGGLGPNFVANNGQGYATSLGGVLTGNNSLGSWLSGLGPTFWIAGGAVLVVLGVVMFANNETNPAALVSKVAKVA